jgi:predicted transposase YdaD
VITLPESLEIRYNEHIHKLEEELNMPYITSAERIGMEKGELKGRLEGRLEGEHIMILRFLQHKFRKIPEKYSQYLAQANAETLLALSERVLDATCLEEVFSEDLI